MTEASLIRPQPSLTCTPLLGGFDGEPFCLVAPLEGPAIVISSASQLRALLLIYEVFKRSQGPRQKAPG